MSSIRGHGLKFLLFSALVSCASSPPVSDASKAAEPIATSAPLESASPAPAPETSVALAAPSQPRSASQTPNQAQAPAPQTLSGQLAPAAPDAVGKASARVDAPKEQGVDPTQSLHWLQNGNHRFLKHLLRKDGQSGKDIARLISGQHPHAIVIACGDSRVPPEIVFDQKLGEIFVVRTAGEVLDSGVVASVEYAVAHLGARLIVVMGHTSCGAIHAAAHAVPGDNVGSPALGFMVADIQPRIKEAMSKYSAEPDLAHASYANAQGVARDLTKRSDIIREAVERGDVRIQSALYHLESGEVKFE